MADLKAGDPMRDPSRAISILQVAALLAFIASLDWYVNSNVPLGLLYLLPMAIAGRSFARGPLLVLGVACTILAEEFDGFVWTVKTGVPRDFLYLCAFSGIGFFVHEAVASRRREELHLGEVEREMEARREAEEQLKILVQSSPIAILTTDGQGVVLLANEAANRLFGVSPGRLEGKAIDLFLPSLTKVPAFRGGKNSFRTVMQCRGQRRDGEGFIAEVWFSTYLTSKGPRLAAMVVDTSQDMRDREEANLHHLLAGSRILVGAVSHEVRNVCGAIAMVHQNLARSQALSMNKDFDALGTLVQALERIASLDLREAVEVPTRVDLYSFLDELKVMIGPGLHEENIEDHWFIDEQLPAVWADRQSLMQVFLNLSRNSEAALAQSERKSFAVSARSEGDQVLIEVADNGPGVPSPESLFRPFQQRSRRVGLGLYLSRALMRSFRGDLRYQPTAAGATFVVLLGAAHEEDDVSF